MTLKPFLKIFEVNACVYVHTLYMAAMPLINNKGFIFTSSKISQNYIYPPFLTLCYLIQ